MGEVVELMTYKYQLKLTLFKTDLKVLRIPTLRHGMHLLQLCIISAKCHISFERRYTLS